MKHLLLTRYNIPINYKSGETQRDPLDPEYLAQRQVLFERFCIPSVVRQTCKDFQWLVFYHPDTPRKYTDVLDGIAVVGYARSNAECAELAKDLANCNGPTITSRIDNDDAIAATFIGDIQKGARDHPSDAPYVLTFPIGAFTSLNRGRYYPKHYVCNPFLSLVEPRGIERTILPYNHGKIMQFLPVHEIATREPMWLSVIHATNVLNQRKRWPWIWQTRPNARLAERFPGFNEACEPAT